MKTYFVQLKVLITFAILLFFVTVTCQAAIHHIDLSDYNKIIIEPNESEPLPQPFTGINGTSDLPSFILTPSMPSEINSASDSVFDRGYDSVRQWTYDFLLKPPEGDQPRSISAGFKVLGLFIALAAFFVIRRLIKLRRLRAKNPDINQRFPNTHFK